MLKRIITSATCLILTQTSVFAFNGLYVGIDLGANSTKMLAEYDFGAIGTGKKLETNYNICYGLHGGYLREIGSSRTFVGGELSVHDTSYSKTEDVGADNNPVAGKVKMTRKFGGTLAVILGKMYNSRTMIYGKVGYEYQRWDHNYRFTSDGSGAPVSFRTTKNLTINGGIVGVGVAYQLSGSLIVGAHYVYAGAFRKQTSLTTSLGANSLTTSFQPTEQRAMIRASVQLG